jgi:hypothetical protein
MIIDEQQITISYSGFTSTIEIDDMTQAWKLLEIFIKFY